MASIEQDIRGFVVENFLFGDAQSLPAPDESFLASGLIDSTGVLELVSFLERQYGITVEDEELIPDNLDSIERLVRFVERKRAARG
ncbi:MAG TPA: acyl carrier protein [Thermodesulfobacteriota bacterium]